MTSNSRKHFSPVQRSCIKPHRRNQKQLFQKSKSTSIEPLSKRIKGKNELSSMIKSKQTRQKSLNWRQFSRKTRLKRSSLRNRSRRSGIRSQLRSHVRDKKSKRRTTKTWWTAWKSSSPPWLNCWAIQWMARIAKSAWWSCSRRSLIEVSSKSSRSHWVLRSNTAVI